MSRSGAGSGDIPVRARAALLDALEALAAHRDAVVVIGAQAVYRRTGGAEVALAEFTKDSDLALDPRLLADEPRVEQAMRSSGFLPGTSNQPGAWVNPDGIPALPTSWCLNGSLALEQPEHAAGVIRRMTAEPYAVRVAWKRRSLTSR
jgi:hypothetical protein